MTETVFSNREAESYLLGAMMYDPSVIPPVINLLSESLAVFNSKDHQLVYEAIVGLVNIGSPVTPMLVSEKIEKDGNLNRAGGAVYLYDLQASVAEIDSVPYYAEIVRACANRRHTQNQASLMSLAALDESKTQEELDDMIVEQASRIQHQRNSGIEPTIEDIVPFPENVITGVFEAYCKAYQGRTEVPKSFLFGTLKTIIGASLGRRVYWQGARRNYPNFFTCCVGQTSLARKSTSLRLAQQMLEQSDQTVFVLRSVATPEGLTAAFSLPAEDEPLGLHTDQDRLEGMREQVIPGQEGVRICLSIDEFSALLKKAGKNHGEGLIQSIADLYDMPTRLDHPTRTAPIVADNPCMSIIGATTLHWLEASLKLEDIAGGLANRITFYTGGTPEWIFEDQPGDPIILADVARTINQLRIRHPNPVAFYLTPEASEYGEAHYKQTRNDLDKQQSEIVKMAGSRIDSHTKKIALLFAAIENEDGDRSISLQTYVKATQLAEYLQKVVLKLYEGFNFSDDKRLEGKIGEVLQNRSQLTAREVGQLIGWASAKQVNESIKQLVENGTLGILNAGKTVRYFVIGEV